MRPPKRELIGQPDNLDAVGRDSLSDKIYERLRVALMTGTYEPGERISIRQLAISYETSPTPVREAVMQLVREGALELRTGHLLRVPNITVDEYLEIRETRVPLERLATERAAANISSATIKMLEDHHAQFIKAESEERWKDALAANQEFHFTIYRTANSAVLLRIIEGLWLLTGPFINHQYPHSRPVYAGPNPHELIIDALRRKSSSEAGEMAVQDIRQGSLPMVERLKRLNADSARETIPSAPRKTRARP